MSTTCTDFSLVGGDEHAQRSWHFPLNKIKREYQFEIIQQCLMKNTLVALPTGLGKTFISAVVIYNFYCWFPAKNIVFLAPTKPLVTQQMGATLTTVEIDPSASVELTGAQSPAQRSELWKTKRVFFLTPQVLQNDLKSGICEASSICLCVFDEAHRALGNHAYCDIVRSLQEASSLDLIRIVALTATPASNVKTVQQLIDNLAITSIAIRTEESMDVRPYLHVKREEIMVVPESEEIKFIRSQFESLVLKPYLEKLNKMKAIYETDLTKLAPFTLLQARDQFRRRRVAQMGAGTPVDGAAEGIFAVLISLYHAYELLQLHGIVCFKNYLTRLPNEGEAALQSRIRNELACNPSFSQLLAHIQNEMRKPLFVSHPKVDIVERILLQHFLDHQSGAAETSAIVFSQFRESVFEIVAKLNVHVPLLKVMSFVGQSAQSSSSSSTAITATKSVTQKQQIEVLERFRKGGYNVLVATCIGEEGLDIGNVDLIVCFDMQASPIRMLQRVGRTGRHRDGKVVLLLSQGKEEQRHERTLAQHRAVKKAISNPNGHFVFFHPKQPILPSRPTCIERNFNLDGNNAFVAVQSTLSHAKTKSTMSYPESIAPQILENTPMPKVGKYLSWQRTLHPSIFIPHSNRTRLFVKLLDEFQALGEEEFDSKDSENTYLVPKPKKLFEEDEEIQELERKLRFAIEELSFRKDPFYCPIPHEDYVFAYKSESANSEPMEDDPVRGEPQPEPKIDVLSGMEFDLPDDILIDREIPDEFFEMVSSGQLAEPVFLEQKEVKNEEKIEKNSSSSPISVVSSGDSKGPLPNFRSLKISPSFPSMNPNDEDHESIMTLRRKRPTMLLLNSSVEPSPLKKCKEHKIRKLYSMFVDTQAECEGEGENGSVDPEMEESLGSLVDFIDDEVEEEQDDDNDRLSLQESCSSAPSSDAMMAFYRRTAFDSQDANGFATKPKQFAQKTRLGCQIGESDQSD